MTERSCVSKPERMIYHRNGIRYHSDTMVVISIVSSPRKGGFGDRIARRIEEGAESVGKEVVRFDLNDMRDIRQCQNCEACKSNGGICVDMRDIRQCQNCEACKSNGGICVIKDDIAPVIDAIRDAEGMILTTSIQFNEMNGLFKMVHDRLYCFLDMNATTIMPKGKKLATVVTASADQGSADRVSAALEKVMHEHFFCEPVGRMAYCTWMMPKDRF